jgi:hypothetical protein
VHWFQWNDQSAGGRRDRENHQVGLVDVTGRSHVPFVDIVSHVANKKAAVRHAKPSSPIHALEKLLEDFPSETKGATTTSATNLPATMVSRTRETKRKPKRAAIMANNLGETKKRGVSKGQDGSSVEGKTRRLDSRTYRSDLHRLNLEKNL